MKSERKAGQFVGFVPARKHTIKLTDRTTVFRHDVIGRVKWNLKVSRCSFVLVYRACSINQLLFSITFARHFSAKTIWTQHSANLFQAASRLLSILKSKVGHPQYPRQVLPLPHTHLEAPPFLPQPKGCCSPPSQDDIKTNSVEKHLNIWMPNLCVDLVSLSHLFLLKALRKTGQIWSTLHSTFIDP